MAINSKHLEPGFLDALERYSRQLPIIGVKGQEKLAKSSIAIVGCGGVGTLVAELLARAGAGRLILIDHDVVALENLNRGTLLTEGDVGRPKAVVCAERVHKINSQVEVEARRERLSRDNVDKLLGDADLVVGATDNIASRMLINEYAVEHRKPWIYVAAEDLRGMTMAIIPGKTACLRCIIPRPPGREERGPPILGPVAALASAHAALLAIKLLVGEKVPSAIYVIDAISNTIEEVRVERNPRCPVCSRL